MFVKFFGTAKKVIEMGCPVYNTNRREKEAGT